MSVSEGRNFIVYLLLLFLKQKVTKFSVPKRPGIPATPEQRVRRRSTAQYNHEGPSKKSTYEAIREASGVGNLHHNFYIVGEVTVFIYLLHWAKLHLSSGRESISLTFSLPAAWMISCHLQTLTGHCYWCNTHVTLESPHLQYGVFQSVP